MRLTALDIKALRQADGYSLHLSHDGAQSKARLHLSKRNRSRNRGPFESSDADSTYTIEGSSGQLVTAYFGALYAPGSWRALAQIVRPDDEITFSASTNNNQYMDAAEIPAGKLNDYNGGYQREAYANLYADELRVTVRRYSASTGKHRTIVNDMLLCYSVCPDNTARAIRRAEYRLTVSA